MPPRDFAFWAKLIPAGAIIGGDFNVILDCDRDGLGGKPKLKTSLGCKKIENLCSSFDLTDIWRVRNPESKRFTWKQNNPLIQLAARFLADI